MADGANQEEGCGQQNFMLQRDQELSVAPRIGQLCCNDDMPNTQSSKVQQKLVRVFLTPSLFIFFSNVYLFLGQRGTEHERGRGKEREGDTESETGSRL